MATNGKTSNLLPPGIGFPCFARTSDVAIGIALLAGVSVAVFANGAGQEAAIHPKIETRIAFQT